MPPILPCPIPHPCDLNAVLDDPSCHYTKELNDCNVARAHLRQTLKAARHAAHPDWNEGVKVSSDYISLVNSLILCLDTDSLFVQESVALPWQSHFTSRSKTLFTTQSFRIEYCFSLLVYALCLTNQSTTLVSSLGEYESSIHTSSGSLTVHDETINRASTMLCQAAGVLEFLMGMLTVPEHHNHMPLELRHETLDALKRTLLADANLLAIRRLLSRSVNAAVSTTTPGPPLSKSHPSPSLLAKLNLHVYGLYSSSYALLRNESGKGAKDLLQYLKIASQLSHAMGYKWLGIDAGEEKGGAQTGEAIGFLTLSLDILEGLSSKTTRKTVEKKKNILKNKFSRKKNLPPKPTGVGEVSAGDPKAKSPLERKIVDEIQSVKAFKSAYTALNDRIYFHPVPAPDAIQLKVPAGRAALEMKKYSGPPVVFKAKLMPVNPKKMTSENLFKSTAAPAAVPSFIDAESSSDDSDDLVSDADEDAYFGAGQYF